MPDLLQAPRAPGQVRRLLAGQRSAADLTPADESAIQLAIEVSRDGTHAAIARRLNFLEMLHRPSRRRPQWMGAQARESVQQTALLLIEELRQLTFPDVPVG